MRRGLWGALERRLELDLDVPVFILFIIIITIIIVVTIFIIIIIFILIIFLITVIILPCRVKVSSLMMSIGAKLDQVRSGRGVPHLDD